MANSISNHFAITALQEGVTVQGSLRVDGSLSQNFNTSSGVSIPDWKSNASLRPKIFPVVRRGSVYMSRSQIYDKKWLYNEMEIVFGSDGKSTNFKDDKGDPLFQLGTISKELGGSTYSLDCLTIIGNLASEGNTDLDTIGFSGSVELNGHPISFPNCYVDVKIGMFTTTGYLGVLSPESAILSHPDDSVKITALLYDDSGEEPGTWTVKWYDAGTGETIPGTDGRKEITITADQVTDNLVVRCDFYTNSNKVTTAFASIDDTQDPQFLYVSMDGSNSDYSGQLSPGEKCTITMWVATMDDITAIDSAYSDFSVKFYDGNQSEIISGTPAVSTKDNKGTCEITYDFVAEHGYKITGIVTAS